MRCPFILGRENCLNVHELCVYSELYASILISALTLAVPLKYIERARGPRRYPGFLQCDGVHRISEEIDFSIERIKGEVPLVKSFIFALDLLYCRY